MYRSTSLREAFSSTGLSYSWSSILLMDSEESCRATSTGSRGEEKSCRATSNAANTVIDNQSKDERFVNDRAGPEGEERGPVIGLGRQRQRQGWQSQRETPNPSD